MKEQMLRNLLRQRLNEGTPTEAIRAELVSMGLNDDEIRALANQVSFSDSPPTPIESIHRWLPVVGMLLGLVILGAMAMVVERPVLKGTCLTVGALLTVLSVVLLYISAIDAGHVRFIGLRVRIGILEAIAADPARHGGMLVALVVGILMFIGGYFL